MNKKPLHALENHETAEAAAKLPVLDPHFNPERLLRKSRADLEAWLKKAKIKHFDDPEMEIVHLDMIAGAEAKIQEIQEEMERTRKETMDESFKDGLTDLANRKFFDYQYPRMAATAKRLGQSLSVFFIDLNKLKQTNDTYGHEAGDDLIRNLAFRIRRTVRSGSEDLVARYGGDEIVIVMPHTNEETARKTAQKLLESLETPIQIMQQKPETEEGGTGQTNSIKLKMTASIGVHVVRPSDWLNTKTNTVDIIKCADRAAYAAKHATLQHTQRVLQNRLQTGAPASLNDDTSACIFYDQNTRVSDEQSPINNALRATITKMEAELLARSTQKKSE